MLTVMCPNCRHRFPATGCCEPQNMNEDNTLIHPTTCYYGGLLVPKNYSGGGCIINAPTIIHNKPVINSYNCPGTLVDFDRYQGCGMKTHFFINEEARRPESGCQIITSCDLTGGSVTITTPSIQSGGCVIQSTDAGTLMQTPHVEIRPKLSGGGCLVRNALSIDGQETVPENFSRNERMFLIPPSGCQELPGTRRATSMVNDEKPILSNLINVPMQFQHAMNSRKAEESEPGRNFGSCCCNNVQSLYNVKSNDVPVSECRGPAAADSNSAGVQIQVNATVQLPASLGQCTVNITATTTNPPNSLSGATSRTKNNFNGGGLVQKNEPQNNEAEENFEERRDRTPTTPVSWLMPCPWSFDRYMMDRDAARLSEVKRLFQACGWYHEGLSWQQSENLLKNAAVGRWLMRDSSDSRYMFAVSVQTARGPTSVRVHYFLGQFRLDAEPRLAFAIPLFDCPIKMLEYYVEYSKSVDEHRKEVWVDYSGQLYSEIYLTKPLVKEVRSLSHLARLVIHKYKLPTKHLPPLIRNYLAEYRYTI